MFLKKIFALAAVAVAMTGLVSSANVTALPTNSVVYVYYLDATMSHPVGESGVGCQRYYSWGVKTAYYSVRTISCSQGFPP
jgi:hypothetical protein